MYRGGRSPPPARRRIALGSAIRRQPRGAPRIAYARVLTSKRLLRLAEARGLRSTSPRRSHRPCCWCRWTSSGAPAPSRARPSRARRRRGVAARPQPGHAEESGFRMVPPLRGGRCRCSSRAHARRAAGLTCCAGRRAAAGGPLSGGERRRERNCYDQSRVDQLFHDLLPIVLWGQISDRRARVARARFIEKPFDSLASRLRNSQTARAADPRRGRRGDRVPRGSVGFDRVGPA